MSVSPRRGARVASRAQAHVQWRERFCGIRYGYLSSWPSVSVASVSVAHAPVSYFLSLAPSCAEVTPSGSFPQSVDLVLMDVLIEGEPGGSRCCHGGQLANGSEPSDVLFIDPVHHDASARASTRQSVSTPSLLGRFGRDTKPQRHHFAVTITPADASQTGAPHSARRPTVSCFR